MNPMDLKRGIDLAVDKVLSELKSKAKKLGSSGEIAQVGTISANGEEEIGKKNMPKRWISWKGWSYNSRGIQNKRHNS